MRFFDYIKLAFKNLTRQRSRTALTIIAITVGSLSLILMVSIIISIRQSLVNQFQQFGAFDLVTVVRDPNAVDTNSLVGSSGDQSDGKKLDETTLATLQNLPHVVEATPTATINVSTMRLDGETKKTWANITAFDPDNDVFGISLLAGRKLVSTDMDSIIIGERFASDIGYSGKATDLVGKKVILVSKTGAGSAPDWGDLPQQPPQNADKSWYESQNNKGVEISATIVGVAANGSMDNGNSYITMAWAKRLMTNVSWQYPEKTEGNKDNGPYVQPQLEIVKEDGLARQGYGAIILKVDDQTNLTKVSDEVKVLGYGTNTAQAMLDQINKILSLVGAVLAVIGGISLFVAAIGIINTMIMATYERTREIGVMRACGATKSSIRRLFTFEAAMLGFAGGLLGMAFSLILGIVGRIIVQHNSLALGNIPVSEIGKFPWWLIVAVLLFTTLVGMLSGLYPARRAAKMNPVDALRYE